MNQEQVKEAVLRLAEELKDLYKDKLKAVILYGSVARGTAQEESDIDILVLVDATQEELRNYADALSDISTDFALEFLKVFSIIDVSFQEFSKWKDVSPFYKNVTRDGVMLYAA
ncbi:MAG: nucleotidyltransferase domain-containing protein [Eubacteriales bacterium]|nr:nucleotidyltransferase domain-containing protein [Eubacteriales bacterium]